jgi:hypothetical protein
MAVRIFLPFSAMCLCELEISTNLKRKQLRTTDEGMTVALSTVFPHIGLLCSKEQAQTLHCNRKKKPFGMFGLLM